LSGETKKDNAILYQEMLSHQHSETLLKLEKKLEGIERHLTRLEIDIAMLRVKSGAWGFAAGAMPVVAYALLEMAFRK